MSQEIPEYLKRVYKILSEEPMSIEQIMERLGIKRSTARRYLRELMKLGLVERIDGKYKSVEAAPPKEKPAKRFEDRVLPEDKAFFFYKGLGLPYIMSIRSVGQLLAAVEKGFVDDDAISYTVKQGYLQEWLRSVVGANELAEKVDELKELEGAELREKLVEAIKGFLG